MIAVDIVGHVGGVTFRGPMLRFQKEAETGFEMSPMLLPSSECGPRVKRQWHRSSRASSVKHDVIVCDGDRGGILVALFVSFASTEVVPAQRPSRWRSISDQRKLLMTATDQIRIPQNE